MPAGRTKLALIAHDGRKADLVAFATYDRDRLAEFDLLATATTGDLLAEKVGLPLPEGGSPWV
jgi:methylglyoxal synthase